MWSKSTLGYSNSLVISYIFQFYEWSMKATVVCVRESTKPILCSKWSHSDRAKPILKILLASWTLRTVEKGFRSFNSENLESVDQRPAKLLAIKLWEWFDPGCSRIWAEGDCRIFGRKGRECKSAKFDGQ